MRIRVIIPPNSLLKTKIKEKYTYLYNEYCRTNPTSKSYTRRQLLSNIKNAVSVGANSHIIPIKNHHRNKHGDGFLYSFPLYLMNCSSTRRFCCLPSSVSLSAIGRVAP